MPSVRPKVTNAESGLDERRNPRITWRRLGDDEGVGNARAIQLGGLGDLVEPGFAVEQHDVVIAVLGRLGERLQEGIEDPTAGQ